MSERGPVSAAQEAPPLQYEAAATAQSGLARLKPHPAMKDSGLGWLGNVPANWECRRNGRLFVQRNQTGFADLPILEVSLRTGVQIRNFESSKRKQVLFDAEKYKRACKGDIAYNMMRMWQGAVGIAPVDGLVSPAYVVACPLQEANPRYYEYLFRVDSYMDQVNQFSRGIVADRNRLYWEDFKQMPSPFPPREEQAGIVRFLAYADRRIARYIWAKQKLIKLLEEEKRAIIHRAVTRGLDPNVRFKPSGVELVGDVPEHWEVSRLGRFINLLTGFPFKSEGFTQDEDDIRLLRGINISPGSVRWDNVVHWSRHDRAKYLPFELRCDDIVLGMDRPIIQSGVRVATISERDLPSVVLQRVARIRVQGGLLSDFLLLLLAGKSFSDHLRPIFTGISVPHLSPEQIKSFRFMLPPTVEQAKIVERITATTKRIDAAVECAQREIGLIREYRSRLIADVVTGKVDVREAAARLPDESDEVEQSDGVAIPAEEETEAAEDLADATIEAAAGVDD